MKKLLFLFTIILALSSCGIYKYSDARKNPVNANERVKKNMEEGRGFRLSSLGKKGGDFLFSSAKIFPPHMTFPNLQFLLFPANHQNQ